MSHTILTEPLTADAFAPFGEVLEAAGEPDRLINDGLCGRWHDRARLDIVDGRPGISLFDGVPRTLPLTLEVVERHPLGSQAFIPMTLQDWLVIVAPDEDGVPGRPRAFAVAPGQGVNLARGAWHGVLTPLHAPGLFAVIDRIGPGENLDQHRYVAPWLIVANG